MSTLDAWWAQWKHFMFSTSLTVRLKEGTCTRRPFDMLEPIFKSKYPAITEEEEKAAIALQVLCQAIFDAVLVHMMNTLSPNRDWQKVKSKICEKLYRQKPLLTMQILEQRYPAVDIMCLQESAAVFRDNFELSRLKQTHNLVEPAKLDGKRDQNSLILLSKAAFGDAVEEVTSYVEALFPPGQKLADGDLLVVKAMSSKEKRPYMIASFHGDTNGLLTKPLLTAVDAAARQHFPDHVVVICMDANCYEKEHKGWLSFGDFLDHVHSLGYMSCWGSSPKAEKCRTTCLARTSLQPQLHKAVRHSDIKVKGDINPKDAILFRPDKLVIVTEEEMGSDRQPNPVKDNTGQLEFKEGEPFPSLGFPSDHGIVAVVLKAAL
eukprot:TRINITY_DN26861_c0_g1_i1.p1 TRINITY_DN26861_c0_g1~~TRINITY_DN26861_c0_g1_i1.p1  ORF type:complete len:377 (-),score=94.49 TRINITY_DN26861_c0_g1_i1:39-1169(-)